MGWIGHLLDKLSELAECMKVDTLLEEWKRVIDAHATCYRDLHAKIQPVLKHDQPNHVQVAEVMEHFKSKVLADIQRLGDRIKGVKASIGASEEAEYDCLPKKTRVMTEVLGPQYRHIKGFFQGPSLPVKFLEDYIVRCVCVAVGMSTAAMLLGMVRFGCEYSTTSESPLMH